MCTYAKPIENGKVVTGKNVIPHKPRPEKLFATFQVAWEP